MNTVPSHEAFSATATQLVRDFPKVRRMADHGPVAITSHGRTELVVLSPEHFAKTNGGEDQGISRPDWQLTILLDTIETNVLILDGDMIIRRANRSFCSAIDYDEADIIGRHVMILAAHPSDRYIVDRLHEVLRSRVGEVLIVPSTRSPGRTLQLQLKPWLNGVATFCDDITERTRSGDMAVAAAAADLSLARLHTVGTVQVRSCGTILSTSAAFAQMIGTSPGSLAGTRVQNLFPIQSRVTIADALCETSDETRHYAIEYLKNGMTPASAAISVTSYWTGEHHACAAIALQDLQPPVVSAPTA